MSNRHPHRPDSPVDAPGNAAVNAVQSESGATNADWSQSPSRTLEILLGSIALGFGLVGLFLARNLVLRTETGGIDPRWWPTALSIGAMVLSAVLLTVALLRPPFDRSDLERTTRAGWVKLGFALAIALAYVSLWQIIGYLLATALFLAALVFAFGGRRWGALVIYPVVTSGSTYLLFHTLLKVPL